MNEERKDRLLRCWAFGDRLLVGGEFRYMLFYEVDRETPYEPLSQDAQTFPTENGWHIIGDHLATVDEKKAWFDRWKNLYPKSDYYFAPVMYLRPATKEELAYIYSLTNQSDEPPILKRYYRDKRVWEPFV